MQIPKFQNPAKPLYPWKPSKQQEAVNKFVDSKLDEVKQIVKTADKRNSRLREADKRANRDVKIPQKLNNTAKLQETLYNVGAYNDMRNRKGTSLSYEQAVDGIHGKMTDAAVAKAREMGYDVDVAKGTVTKRQIKREVPKQKSKESTFGEKIYNFFNRGSQENYIPSREQNLKAIMEHKIKNNVSEPYFYVSPKEGKLYRLQGDKILYQSPVATGVNQNTDGWTTLTKDVNGKPIYERYLNSSSTPAGVFTIGHRKDNTYHNEPTFMLREAERENPNARLTPVAIHAPATSDRARRLANGEKRLTYGCIQLPNGEVKCMADKGNISLGDSVYVEPTVSGNYLYEDKDGKIKTHFEGTPSRVTDTVWGQKFDRNDVKYNIGY